MPLWGFWGTPQGQPQTPKLQKSHQVDKEYCSYISTYPSLYVGTFPTHPRGYRTVPHHPVLRGESHCRHCLCAPCVIALPPDFLQGSCSPHPANDEKRHRLYRLFWRLLSDLRVWCDDEYLQRKEARTSIYDKREIIPQCVIAVSKLQCHTV